MHQIMQPSTIRLLKPGYSIRFNRFGFNRPCYRRRARCWMDDLCRRNSIGDHIPAYLINTILALENGSDPSFRQECIDILKECTRLIVDKFVKNGLQVRARRVLTADGDEWDKQFKGPPPLACPRARAGFGIIQCNRSGKAVPCFESDWGHY